ncbi:hypothetical protein J4N45_09875 [Vibrio sp. SCSIO 43140]|uniref:hypothetical protein n=1 Tax=Vibrio sp. SCSIO 43140 TaxID=2819100 RepID=UPI002076294D|nr:hypothetical protein [Vibrio sp. SCSIO 43140]USD58836.1 hypothetical protein J4N45_09875 [Vibrio sp. SCSIO 43140]
MHVKLADASVSRIQAMDFTTSVLAEIHLQGIEVPVLEIDDDSDNLFVKITDPDDELFGKHYLSIRFDSDYYSDTPVYFAECRLRMHSGGDLYINEDQDIEILPTELEANIDAVCQLYLSLLEQVK